MTIISYFALNTSADWDPGLSQNPKADSTCSPNANPQIPVDTADKMSGDVGVLHGN